MERTKLMRELSLLSQSDEFDFHYVYGFAETLALLEGANLNLKPEMICRVAWVWRDYDCDSDWSGGFVFELTNGNRVYVESHSDGASWGPDSVLKVTRMAANDDLPALEDRHPSRLYGWARDPAELAEYLKRLSDRP